MSYSELDLRPVIELDETTRGDFVVRVYQHLMGAIAAFVAIEALFFTTGFAEGVYNFVSGGGSRWLLIMGLFMVGQWMVGQAPQSRLKVRASIAANALDNAFVLQNAQIFQGHGARNRMSGIGKAVCELSFVVNQPACHPLTDHHC